MKFDALINKINAAAKVIEIFRDFYPEFKKSFDKLCENVVIQLEKNLHKDFDDKKNKLIDRIKSINSLSYDELDGASKQKLIFQTFELIKQFDNILFALHDIIKKYSVQESVFVDSDISDSSKMSAIKSEKILMKSFIEFSKQYNNKIMMQDTTWFYFSMLLNTISDNILSDLDNINSLYRKYKNTIELYAYFMQYVLDTYDKTVNEYVLGLIDGNKTYSLQYNGEKKKGPQNPFIRKFGLIPYTDFLSISELFDVSSKSGMKKKLDHPVIILKYITEIPINYKLWELVDYYKAKDKGIGKGFTERGIDEYLIERMKTINYMPENRKWDFSSFEYIDDKRAKEYYEKY